jgi:glyoxylase-like metal-dependent hydrolase (beta-lactamase superfamily II)
MRQPGFNLTFSASTGQPVPVALDVLRLTAPNPGLMTFTGTNTYIVGNEALAIIDPGPDDNDHLFALMQCIGPRTVSHILTTHDHDDHIALAPKLAEKTGSQWLRDIKHGASIIGHSWALEAIHTPGHTGNHTCFSLTDKDVLFTGDHVMGWSTTVILPPDGKMSDYMQSLDHLLRRPERLYLPGHGGEIRNPKSFVKALKSHRKMRETAILQRLRSGDRHIHQIVAALYRETDPRLYGAAAMSVLAHLEALTERGLVASGAGPSLEANYGLV